MKRQLLQHRLKINIHGGTGHIQPRGNWVKRGFNLPKPVTTALTTEAGEAITTEGGAPITV